MKRKISRILGVGLTLALLTSLMVVAPVSALTSASVVLTHTTAALADDIDQDGVTYTVSFELGKELPAPATYTLHGTDDAQTAVWSSAQSASGAYSVLLTHGSGATKRAWVEFTPPTGITLDEFVAAPDTYGFSYWRVEDKIGPQLELTFTDGALGWVELTAEMALYDYTDDDLTGEWIDKLASGTEQCQFFGDDSADGSFSSGGLGDLSDLITDIAAQATADDAAAVGAWELTKAVVDLGWSGDTQTAYIDDIIIAGVTHDFDGHNTITVTFPTGTEITGATATIMASPGWRSGEWSESVTDSITFAVDDAPTALTVKATLNGADQIGEGSTVRFEIAGIRNPPAIGSYTLTVKTSQEYTAITSASYSIEAPTILANPGTVNLYNSVGVLVLSPSGANRIQTAINDAGSGYRIEVGPGSYDEAIDINKNVTVVSTDGAAVTIITDVNGDNDGGLVTISVSRTSTAQGVVLDGFTILGNGDIDWTIPPYSGVNPPVLTITGDGATVQNCILGKYEISTEYYPNQTLISYTAAGDLYGGLITDNTFDAAISGYVDTGIEVTDNANRLTISNNTFTVDQDYLAPVVVTGALQDTAIISAGGGDQGATVDPIIITGNTIGSDWSGAGNGIQITDGVANITDTTISGIMFPLEITGGTVTVTDSTITGSGRAISTTMLQGIAAVDISGATSVVAIRNSTISDSASYAVLVAAEATPANINIMFNEITGNADNVYSQMEGTLNVTHNWWGDAAGPASGSIDGTSATVLVDASGYLGGPATGSFDTDKTSLLAETTVGVDVTVTGGTGDMDVVGVANYARNPQDATPEPPLGGGFYDVLVSGPDTNITEITLKFYNANVSENTVIYVWSELQGAWALCAPATAGDPAAQGVNTFGGYAWVEVSAVTTPAIADLAGTEFALCEMPVTEESIAPAITSPTFGADEVSVTPTLIWTEIVEATGYELVVALAPDFLIPHSAATSELNGYVFEEALKYSTTYYWRVRAITPDLTSTWTMGMFSTMADPAEAAAAVAPDVTVEAPPAADIDVTVEAPPAADVTVEIAPDEIVQVIPDYLLWVIVAVGALLVIAVIVLIVRTRRVV